MGEETKNSSKLLSESNFPQPETTRSHPQTQHDNETSKPKHMKKRKKRNKKKAKETVDTEKDIDNNTSHNNNKASQKINSKANTGNNSNKQTTVEEPNQESKNSENPVPTSNQNKPPAKKSEPKPEPEPEPKPALLDPPELQLPHLQSPNLELEMPVNSFETSPGSQMSPRRQAIMRYKKSDDHMNNGSIINKVKGSLKSKSRNPPAKLAPNEPGTAQSPETHVDEKISLFKYKSSKILVFDEDMEKSESGGKSGSGRLLGHGEFEIFQLHNGDVTYLACGTSFIYPLLPKLKMLRISFNQFILPLVNPDRYWKIHINSDDDKIIQSLENTLEHVVQYRNLAIGAQPVASKESSSHGSLKIPDFPNTITEVPKTPRSNLLDFNMAQISNEIPDTPPSAPLSPHNEHSGVLDLHLGSPLKPPVINAELHHMETLIHRDNSNKSISSALASFDINKIEQAKISKKYPTANPYQKPSHRMDEKSDSSMDSLLDEYEESMSVSKSFTYTRSRAPSRALSRTSSFVQPPVNYTRGEFFPGNIEAKDPDHEQDDYKLNSSFPSKQNDTDLFPSTSLSEYNRVHNVRSRRSSRSELYTSESNWMEPNPNSRTEPNRIPNSRSSYSVSSQYQGHDLRNSDLNSTYRQIYKSITLRNLAQVANDRNDDIRSVRSYQRLPTIQQSKALGRTANGSEKYLTSSVRNDYSHSRYGPNKPKNHSTSSQKSTLSSSATKLNSDEVYKMISAKRERGPEASVNSRPGSSRNKSHLQPQPYPQEKKGLASRLFGW